MIIHHWTEIEGGSGFSALDTESGLDELLGVPAIPPGWTSIGLVNEALALYDDYTDEASGERFLDKVGAAPLSGSSHSDINVSGGIILATWLTSWGFIVIASEVYEPFDVVKALRVTVPPTGAAFLNEYTLPAWVASVMADGSAFADVIECAAGTRLLLQSGTSLRFSAPLTTATTAWTQAGSVAIPNIAEPSSDDEYLLRGAELAHAVVAAVRALGDEVLRLPLLELGSDRAIYGRYQNRSLVDGDDLLLADTREVTEETEDGWNTVDTALWSWRARVAGGVATIAEQKMVSLLALTGEVYLGNNWIFATEFSNAPPPNFWMGLQLAVEIL